MPMYSFHATGDENGVRSACADIEAARREAVAICGDLARDVLGRLVPQRDWCLTVADDKGKIIIRFRMCEDKV